MLTLTGEAFDLGKSNCYRVAARSFEGSFDHHTAGDVARARNLNFPASSSFVVVEPFHFQLSEQSHQKNKSGLGVVSP